MSIRFELTDINLKPQSNLIKKLLLIYNALCNLKIIIFIYIEFYQYLPTKNKFYDLLL